MYFGFYCSFSFISYIKQYKIIKKDPFQSIDQTGVGEFVKLGIQKGKSANEKLKIGICGEKIGPALHQENRDLQEQDRPSDISAD